MYLTQILAREGNSQRLADATTGRTKRVPPKSRNSPHAPREPRSHPRLPPAPSARSAGAGRSSLAPSPQSPFGDFAQPHFSPSAAELPPPLCNAGTRGSARFRRGPAAEPPAPAGNGAHGAPPRRPPRRSPAAAAALPPPHVPPRPGPAPGRSPPRTRSAARPRNGPRAAATGTGPGHPPPPATPPPATPPPPRSRRPRRRRSGSAPAATWRCRPPRRLPPRPRRRESRDPRRAASALPRGPEPPEVEESKRAPAERGRPAPGSPNHYCGGGEEVGAELPPAARSGRDGRARRPWRAHPRETAPRSSGRGSEEARGRLAAGSGPPLVSSAPGGR